MKTFRFEHCRKRLKSRLNKLGFVCSIHKSRKVQAFIKKHSWVELFYLPPYSPEHNPIERFWYWLKQKVYGCKSFAKMDDLIQQVRKLIWHYHEGRTVSTINFNYDAYADLL